MNLGDFKIGERFACAGRKWLTTDIGTRTISAICLTVCGSNDYARNLPENVQGMAWERDPAEVDPSWLQGPPYALAEISFDENDFAGCEAL